MCVCMCVHVCVHVCVYLCEWECDSGSVSVRSGVFVGCGCALSVHY